VTSLWNDAGKSEAEVLGHVRDALERIVDRSPREGYPIVLSFPMTHPQAVAVEAFKLALPRQPNNIITTTRHRGELEHMGSRELEREAVYMAAELCGSSDPAAAVDGYITPGGTEANIQALWIARNMLCAGRLGPAHVAVISSFGMHYSIPKACDILGLTAPHLVGCNNDLSVSIERLGAALELEYASGRRRFCIVANVGTSMTGAVDDVGAIGALLEAFEAKHDDAQCYLHVDAAFAGFALPFLDPPVGGWGFDTARVMSITIDPHKLALAPAPAGMFLCRKDLQKYVSQRVHYLDDDVDDTISGSRSGAAAIAVWALFKSMGKSGFREMMASLMDGKACLIEQLTETGLFEIIDSPINQFGLVIRDDVGESTRDALCDLFSDASRYVLRSDMLPGDPLDLGSAPQRVWKIIVMPHLSAAQIDTLVADIRRVAR
jgi:glutamate/tyrosine decarboxylase-like PLP-dependent enzyme